MNIDKHMLDIILSDVELNSSMNLDIVTVAKNYIKFCLGKWEYLGIPETSLINLLGTISRFVVYGLSIWVFAMDEGIARCIYYFLLSLFLFNLNFLNFTVQYVRRVLKKYKKEVIEEYEKIEESYEEIK